MSDFNPAGKLTKNDVGETYWCKFCGLGNHDTGQHQKIALAKKHLRDALGDIGLHLHLVTRCRPT